MAAVVPSRIDQYLSRSFTFGQPAGVYDVQKKLGAVAGLLELYDRAPDELITCGDDDHARLVAAIGAVRMSLDQYRYGKIHDCLAPVGGGIDAAWAVIKTLPDGVPSAQNDLSFIQDVVLRELIGADISAIATDLQSGEWKSATVLAGSCSEALLLYALETRRRNGPTSITVALTALNMRRPPDASNLIDISWILYCYTAVAHKLNLITDGTRDELDTARDFRNLIHPARVMREQIQCERGTAFCSVGAMDHVVRDLKKSL